MYKIVELNEIEITNFNGKIVQVINSTLKESIVSRDLFGLANTSYMWVLTCLVEE